MIIDAQVHCYEANSPQRPWVSSHAFGLPECTGREQVAAMDAVGVDGAVLVSPWGMYGFDPSYAQEVQAEFPTRFVLVAPIDPYEAGAADRVRAWADVPASVGIRVLPPYIEGYQVGDPQVAEVVQATVDGGLSICLFCPGVPGVVEDLARLYPDAQFVIDHLGLHQPMQPPVPDVPFVGLDAVLALAQYPNVAIKVTGACTLSKQPYPFADIWEPVARVFDSFGIDRCMWGTDWTRAVDLVSHEDAVRAFREYTGLSTEERASLMGGTLERIFGWPADGAND